MWVLRSNVSPDFTPIRSELANARGFSRGVLNFVVLPAAEPFTHARAWSVILCGAIFLLVTIYGSTWGPPSGGPIRLKPDPTYKTLTIATVTAASAIALLVLVALSPYVTP